MALGDATGLRELEYPAEAGGHTHTLHAREWRPGRDAAIGAHYTQPVAAERLDDVMSRYGLPRPQALRISTRRGAADVLRGGAALLKDPQLRSVLAAVKGDDEARAVCAALERHRFTRVAAAETGMYRTLVMAR
jgi:hypothetical protein